MNGEPLEPPTPELLAWLNQERPLAEVPATVRERIYLRLQRTLGFGGPGGGPAGAGLSGMMIGGLLALLAGGGTVAYMAVRALVSEPAAGDAAGGAGSGDAAGGKETSGRASADRAGGGRSLPPRWQPGVGSGAAAGGGAALTGGAAPEGAGGGGEPAPELPGWVGQRNVERQPIAGIVLDGGRPAPSVEVALEGIASAADPRFALRVTTGGDGRFAFGPQPAWHYVVSASAPGRRPAAVRFRLGDPTARPAPTALVLELAECAAGVWGVVTDQSGRGVPEVRIRRTADSFSGPSVETDQNGRYELCADAGPVRLRVEGEGYGVVFVPTTAAATRTRTDIQLSSEAVAIGTTVTLQGVPLPGVQLNLFPSGRGQNSAQPAAPISAISDHQGRFEARGLAPGRYWMNAWSANYMGRESAVVELRAGEIKRSIVRRLHPTSQVDATVVWNGRPVAGAATSLAIRGTEDDSSFGAVTQADGRVTLHGVFHGDNEFRIRGYRVRTPASVQVTSQRLTGIVVDVEPAPPPKP